MKREMNKTEAMALLGFVIAVVVVVVYIVGIIWMWNNGTLTAIRGLVYSAIASCLICWWYPNQEDGDAFFDYMEENKGE